MTSSAASVPMRVPTTLPSDPSGGGGSLESCGGASLGSCGGGGSLGGCGGGGKLGGELVQQSPQTEVQPRLVVTTVASEQGSWKRELHGSDAPSSVVHVCSHEAGGGSRGGGVGGGAAGEGGGGVQWAAGTEMSTDGHERAPP